MREYLFVYGTLMGETPDAGVNRVLRQYCEDAGEGWVPGRLYRLGWYPGLVLEAGSRARRVPGRLLKLKAPARCWPVLDAYEGYRPEAPAHGEYRRCRVRVERVSGGRSLLAWVYVYQGPLSRGEPIERWPPSVHARVMPS
ncbi:gamma-glutamylcyclotransferase family protein [Thioalkalivibrio sulfidiphilus]|uniref:AIG2 family protein n=1 Tax=Thioalkalivibrio sulfidiphilus (strain HL-EbGR7) TaxID=396588 RepID=B8GQZ0_THISH|nr:gamma-glutamylcyclotransferase family protein [Thioalkalivibrio sulfidiphilus]ACL72410.1 AIG2 family protein [Thioalkalivibrio sulfidiphilus HL-EbGr7]